MRVCFIRKTHKKLFLGVAFYLAQVQLYYYINYLSIIKSNQFYRHKRSMIIINPYYQY